MINKWLQWSNTFDRSKNEVVVLLNEYTQSATDKWPKIECVGQKIIKIRFWTDEHSLCVSLNKAQRQLFQRYVYSYKKWHSFREKVLKNFTGGKIIIDDIETTKFINRHK